MDAEVQPINSSTTRAPATRGFRLMGVERKKSPTYYAEKTRHATALETVRVSSRLGVVDGARRDAGLTRDSGRLRRFMDWYDFVRRGQSVGYGPDQYQPRRDYHRNRWDRSLVPGAIPASALRFRGG